MGIFRKNDRVEDVRTGAHGSVVQRHPSGIVTVSWDANKHGGYIDHATPAELAPVTSCSDPGCMGCFRS